MNNLQITGFTILIISGLLAASITSAGAGCTAVVDAAITETEEMSESVVVEDSSTVYDASEDFTCIAGIEEDTG